MDRDKLKQAHEIGRKYQIFNNKAIQTIARHLEDDNFDQWLESYLMKRKRQLHGNTRIFKRGVVSFTAREIVIQTGISESQALARLRSWERGDLSFNGLLKPKKRKRKAFSATRDGKTVSLREVMEKTNLSEVTARRRLQQWARGEISEKKLFLPKHSNLYAKDEKVISTCEVCEKTGLTLSGAMKRINLWKEGKISSEDLLKPKSTARPQTVYEKDGKTLTASQVAARTGLSPGGARNRLKAWEAGKISYEEVLRENRKKEVVDFKKDGKTLKISEVVKKTGLSYWGARRRLYLWLEGKITYEKLFKPARSKKPVKKPRKKLKKKLVVKRIRVFNEQTLLDKIKGPTECERKYFG